MGLVRFLKADLQDWTSDAVKSLGNYAFNCKSVVKFSVTGENISQPDTRHLMFRHCNALTNPTLH